MFPAHNPPCWQQLVKATAPVGSSLTAPRLVVVFRHPLGSPTCETDPHKARLMTLCLSPLPQMRRLYLMQNKMNK